MDLHVNDLHKVMQTDVPGVLNAIILTEKKKSKEKTMLMVLSYLITAKKQMHVPMK